MKSLAIVLYVVCFGVYVLFTRQPDFIDGEQADGKVELVKDSLGNTIQQIRFHTGWKEFVVQDNYLFRFFKQGEQVVMVYEKSAPEKGKVLHWWGYWLRWDECLMSIVLLGAMLAAAFSVTSQPTPEALLEQLSYEPEKKSKYS